MNQLRSSVALILAAGCVVGKVEHAVPPRVTTFEVTPQGWCGTCADVTVDWVVETTDPQLAVKVVVFFDGKTVDTFTAVSGSEVVQVCGTSGEGATGMVSIEVPSLTAAQPPKTLQQTVDGQTYALGFECVEPFTDAWAPELGFDNPLLFPPSIEVSEIRNWTFVDTNGNGLPDSGESAPKTRLLKPPAVADFIAENTWKPAPAGTRLGQPWQAQLENPTAWSGRRCLPKGEPATDEFAIDLGALVRVSCVE